MITYKQVAADIVSRYNKNYKSIKPTQINKHYGEGGYHEITANINDICQYFQKNGWIKITMDTYVIGKITFLNVAPLAMEYNLTLRSEVVNDLLNVISRYRSHSNDKISLIAKDIQEKLNSGKSIITTDFNELNDIFNSLIFMFNNNNDISLRTASVNLLNDSKKLENLAGKLKSILKQTDLSDTEFFEQYNIHRNETFVIFKGPAIIEYNDGTVFEHKCYYGQRQISATELKSINCIKTDHILGIENLTSFNNFHSDEKATVVYIGGYAKNVIVDFIKKCVSNEYYHWGDIDYDGFQILKDLTNRTSKEFKPYKMDIDTAMKYKAFARPMTEHHKDGLATMASEGSDIAKYLLDNDCLIEQECIDI